MQFKLSCVPHTHTQPRSITKSGRIGGFVLFFGLFLYERAIHSIPMLLSLSISLHNASISCKLLAVKVL